MSSDVSIAKIIPVDFLFNRFREKQNETMVPCLKLVSNFFVSYEASMLDCLETVPW